MELDIVVNGLIDSRDAALSECGVAEYHFSFCDKQYFQLFRQVQSGIQTACARSCNNNVIIFGHNYTSFDMYKIHVRYRCIHL